MSQFLRSREEYLAAIKAFNARELDATKLEQERAELWQLITAYEKTDIEVLRWMDERWKG